MLTSSMPCHGRRELGGPRPRVMDEGHGNTHPRLLRQNRAGDSLEVVHVEDRVERRARVEQRLPPPVLLRHLLYGLDERALVDEPKSYPG